MEHGVSSIGGCNLSCMTRAHLIYGNGKMREDGGRDADVYMEAILFANVFDKNGRVLGQKPEAAI